MRLLAAQGQLLELPKPGLEQALEAWSVEGLLRPAAAAARERHMMPPPQLARLPVATGPLDAVSASEAALSGASQLLTASIRLADACGSMYDSGL